jgi:hypothetical protein
MAKPQVLIQATAEIAGQASKLVLAAGFEPILDSHPDFRAKRILHQIQPTPEEISETEPVTVLAERVWRVATEVQKRYQEGTIVYFLAAIPDEKYLELIAHLSTADAPYRLNLTKYITDAVARIIQAEQNDEQGREQDAFVLDLVSGVSALGDDLRDDRSGKLDTKKVADLFGVSVPDIAKAVGVTPQALSSDPTNDRAQPVLRLFERIARLRAHPQFKEPSELRRWFRRPLPVLGDHSGEDLFKAGKLEIVAVKVDQMLTGEFGG